MDTIDLLLVNGRIAGAGVETSHAWLAFGSGEIVARGDAGSTPPPASRRLDVKGRVLAPAFVDHHVHLLNVGMSALNRDRNESLFLDLSGATSIDEIAAAVAARAATEPAGEWILGKGWSQGAWGADELPDREPLDRAAPRHPVLLTRVDAHAGWVNAQALRRAGVDREAANAVAGEIQRRRNGEPSGILLERAIEPVVAALPPVDETTLRDAFRLGASTLAAQGVTEIFDAGFLAPPGIVALNLELERILRVLLAVDTESPLPLRIWLMIPAPSRLAEKVLARPDAFRRLTPRIGVSHLKLFADGALGSRGASMSQPFADAPGSQGVARMSEQEILQWSNRALAADLDVATHAIGDAAVHRTLAAYEQLLQQRPDTDPRRLRIEHFSSASEEDMRQAAALGVVLSVQPNFVLPDDDGATMEDARLGERSDLAYAWGRLDGLGARLAGGSDYFTIPFAPLFNFHAAATRANERGLPPGGWHPGDRLSRGRSWQLFTSLYAPGGGTARQRTLAPGQVADVVILSGDPLQVVEAEIPGIRVHATLLAGRSTHDDGTLSELASVR